MKPLKQWVCDTCGELIAEPEQGWIEWRTDENLRAYGFRIVHHRKYSPRTDHSQARGPSCYQYDHASRGDMHLDCYVGEDGMASFLTFLDSGPDHVPDYKGAEVVNVREWTEIYRRLYLPHYEEARLYWKQAREDDFFGDMNESAIYAQGTLKRIIENYGG